MAKMTPERREELNGDLTGTTNGSLVVIGPVPNQPYKKLFWNVQCPCGTIVPMNRSRILRKSVSSLECCLAKALLDSAKEKCASRDLVGNTFKSLRVTDIILDGTSFRDTEYRCVCSCGAESSHLGHKLINRKEERCQSCKLIYKDLSGLTFGKLLVLKMTGRTQASGTYIWRCKCECGEEIDIVGIELTGKRKRKSCSKCTAQDKRSIVGKSYGRVRVTGLSRRTPTGFLWNVECECGKKSVSKLRYFKTGRLSYCDCTDNHRVGKKQSQASWSSPEHLRSAGFRSIYANYRNSAIIRSLAFEIDEQTFYDLSQERCFYCDEDPSLKSSDKNKSFTYNGIDRLDNESGYISGNIVACCSVCNRMKNKWDLETFISKVDKIHANLKNKLKA